MKEEFLNKLREYLLVFDENIQEDIRKSLSEDDFEIVSAIENVFLSDEHIDAIIQELQLETIQQEIKDLHAEYYLQLAELYAEGKTNKEIDTLLSTGNQTFKKTVSLFPDEATFFKELSIAVDDTKTEQLKKGYAEIDEWLQSKKSTSNKDVSEVVSIRRKIFRYAIAATVVGVLIGGAYLRFFNHEVNNDNSIVANIEIPNLVESIESNKSIIIDKRGSSFAGNPSIKDSISIQTNGLTKQIDTLRAILEKTITDNAGEHGQTNSRISKQIDSLLNILNTYSYNNKTKKVVLNVPKVSIVKNIIYINLNSLSEFYINLEGKYYLIKNTEAPLKLYPVTDKKEIEKLKKIELLN